MTTKHWSQRVLVTARQSRSLTHWIAWDASRVFRDQAELVYAAFARLAAVMDAMASERRTQPTYTAPTTQRFEGIGIITRFVDLPPIYYVCEQALLDEIKRMNVRM